MKTITSNIVKTWFKILLTTLILWSVVSLANANYANDSLESKEIGITQSVRNTIQDSLPDPSVTLMEVRAEQVNIRTQYVKSRTGQKPSYTHVDSLYNNFKQDYKDLASYVIAYNELQKIKENDLKAKAYLVIPISILLWLLLIWIGVNRQDKILINVACILLISSVIGTAVVLPILLVGLKLAPF